MMPKFFSQPPKGNTKGHHHQGFRGLSDDFVDPLQQDKIYRKDRKGSSCADNVSEGARSWLVSILEEDAVQNLCIEPPKQCTQLIGLRNVEDAVKRLQ
jgi:hypothetical protein